MMEAKELRIGNFVQSKRGKLLKFVGITPINQNLYCVNEDGRLIDDNEINPIELNENWLVKFGLKEKPNYTAFHIGAMQFDIPSMIGGFHDNEYGLDEEQSIKLKYVHQIQNLYFALTGQELELK